MFKNIFITLFSLITSPASIWKKLSEEDTAQDLFLNRFLYPLIGIMSLSVFIGTLFIAREYDLYDSIEFKEALQVSIKKMITVLVSGFLGFYFAAFVLNELLVKFFDREPDIKLSQRFVGYSMSIIFVISIIMFLFPGFALLRFAAIYVIYVIWEGSETFMQIAEKKRILFVILSSSVIILSEPIIEKLMHLILI